MCACACVYMYLDICAWVLCSGLKHPRILALKKYKTKLIGNYTTIFLWQEAIITIQRDFFLHEMNEMKLQNTDIVGRWPTRGNYITLVVLSNWYLYYTGGKVEASIMWDEKKEKSFVMWTPRVELWDMKLTFGSVIYKARRPWMRGGDARSPKVLAEVDVRFVIDI